MKQTFKLFQIGLRQITYDGMLLVLLAAPFLFGLMVKMGLPNADAWLYQHWAFSIKPWYSLADGMMMTLTSMLLSMVSAFLLLEERDEGTGAYYQITPLEGYSYLVARIGLPMVWSFLCMMIVTMLFGIANLTFLQIIAAGLISTLTGAALAMMVVSLAGNRVEGLAISKLATLNVLGLLMAWFVPMPYQYLGAFLPGYWIGEIVQQGVNWSSFLAGFMMCIAWIVAFTRKFLRKI
ncbi:hypothetical protein Desde_1610 [Desulfitobacterium dehalogenans ATCC 51507]|uniref:Uncharacterized protein n=1 Tax=Desulfitobacterium dehalogenans (strain ATCC 51507 / DSM 9161 / JW/IU-DC1) TaxID=756499 RepID=I4A7S8_DESDJ|nr:hypothetical protein [Desulfitobacterium dehalogenans]AFM00013.1 hypothetical protein Desde_1610 [Desulfitobacterium dehalogenans ATCC 51507]